MNWMTLKKIRRKCAQKWTINSRKCKGKSCSSRMCSKKLKGRELSRPITWGKKCFCRLERSKSRCLTWVRINWLGRQNWLFSRTLSWRGNWSTSRSRLSIWCTKTTRCRGSLRVWKKSWPITKTWKKSSQKGLTSAKKSSKSTSNKLKASLRS